MSKSPRRLRRLGEVDARTPRSWSRSSPVQRPGRPAEDHHRHREAADRVRRPDPALPVPRQAAARSTRCCRRSRRTNRVVPAEQDPRADRRLPRHLRRRRQVAGLRREVRAAGHLQHRGAEGAARPGDGRGAGVLPRCRPHGRRLRGPDRRRRQRSPTTPPRTRSGWRTASCRSCGRRSAPTRCSRRTATTTGG